MVPTGKESKLKCECAIKNTENYTVAHLGHHFVLVTDVQKELELLLYFLHILDYRKAIIFVKNSIRCSYLSGYLKEHGHPKTISINKSIPNVVRTMRFKQFREGQEETKLLVTSCISHGMEVKNVDIIINFDEARSPAEYNHRVCSKGARKGLVVTFVRKVKYLRVLKGVQQTYNVKVSPLPLQISVDSYIDFPGNGSSDDDDDSDTDSDSDREELVASPYFADTVNLTPRTE